MMMMQETPHDFFPTHPDDFLAGTIARPTIVAFDVGAEFNGQGLIANTWREYEANHLDLRHYLVRTELTARLHRTVAYSCFGFRL